MTAVRAAGYTSSLTRGEFKEVTNNNLFITAISVIQSVYKCLNLDYHLIRVWLVICIAAYFHYYLKLLK